MIKIGLGYIKITTRNDVSGIKCKHSVKTVVNKSFEQIMM